MFVDYTVARTCVSPKIQLGSPDRFCLRRGWGLETRLSILDLTRLSHSHSIVSHAALIRTYVVTYISIETMLLNYAFTGWVGPTPCCQPGRP